MNSYEEYGERSLSLQNEGRHEINRLQSERKHLSQTTKPTHENILH